MNMDAVLLVRTARTLVEHWRANAYEGDLNAVNEHIELLAVSLHKLGLTTEEVSAQYAPDRNVVGLADLVNVGTAIVAALEGIRTELAVENHKISRSSEQYARGNQLDGIIAELLPRMRKDAKSA